MESLKIKQFLQAAESGYCNGDGSGYGSGAGSGYGSGNGYGYGSGSGSGYCYCNGSGYGYGYGSGDGNGNGYGNGYGYGSGNGYGAGSGDGIGCVNDRPVYQIDDVQTILTSIHGDAAKGFILGADLTMTPCYVVKGRGQFAHGSTLRAATDALASKLLLGMPEDERIAAFIQDHPDRNELYPNADLFEWHHRLTGSCLAGRNAFVKDRGIDLAGESTVTEFMRITERAYGGSVIRNLRQKYDALRDPLTE